MNFKTTIALLLLLIIVGFFFYTQQDWTTTRDVEQSAAQQSADGLPLFTADELSTESINRIEIERDDTRFVFEQEGEQWFQTHPVRVELNGWSARGIIDDLAGLAYREKLTPGKDQVPDAASLGLEPPRAVVTITGEMDKETKSFTVALGRPSLGGRGYAMLPQRDGEAAYLVNDDLHDAVLETDLKSLRKRSLPGPDAGSVQRVRLERGNETIELVHAGDRWVFAGDHGGRADTAAGNALANALKNTFVEAWVQDQPEDLSLYGLNQPTARLALTTKAPGEAPEESEADEQADEQAKTHTLLIGSPTELEGDTRFGMLLAGDQERAPVFTVGKTYTEKLNVPVAELRDTAISLLEPQAVRSLRLERASGGLAFDKSPDGWAFAEGSDPGFDADTAALAELVETLTGTEGEPVTDASAWAGQPVTTVLLTTITQPEPETLGFYTAPDDKAVVVRNREPVGYEVDRELLQSVTAPPLAFRERDIEVVTDAADQITLSQPDGPTFAFMRNEADWKLQGHDTFEDAAFNDLLGMLSPLRAEAWVTDGAEPGEEALSVTVTGDGQTVTLRVDPETRTATRSGIDEPFRVSSELVKALRAEYRERTVIPVAAAAISRVVITEPDGLVTSIGRDGESWVSAGDQSLDTDAVAALVDTLAGLEAVRFTSTPVLAQLNPERTLEVSTTVGDTYTVNLFPKKNTATVNGRPIELDKPTLEALRGWVLSTE